MNAIKEIAFYPLNGIFIRSSMERDISPFEFCVNPVPDWMRLLTQHTFVACGKPSSRSLHLQQSSTSPPNQQQVEQMRERMQCSWDSGSAYSSFSMHVECVKSVSFMLVRCFLSSAHDSRRTCAVGHPLNRPLTVLLFSRLSVHAIVWQMHTHPYVAMFVRSVSSCWIYKWVMQYVLVARSHIALPHHHVCVGVYSISAWARTSAYVHVSLHCKCMHACSHVCVWYSNTILTTTTHTETARTELNFFSSSFHSHYSHTHNEQIAWFRYVV